jgi:hypothetical protein
MYTGFIHRLTSGAQAVTKTAIRSIPNKLSHARIYLDDLFEIEEILSHEYAKLPKPPKITFEYEIDGKIILTTHEELIEHEGSSKRFALNVVSDNSFLSERRVLNVYSQLEPTFEAPYIFEDLRWAIFGKVAEIFKARSDKLKNFSGLFSTELLLLIVAPGVLYFILTVSHTWLTYSLPVGIMIQVLPSAFVTITSFLRLRSNRVYFRLHQKDEKARTAAIKERIEKLFWLLAGAVIGTIATLIADHLKHN